MKTAFSILLLILVMSSCSKPKTMLVLAGQSNAVPLADTLAFHYKKITGNEAYIIQVAKGGSALNEKAQTHDWGNWSSNGELLAASFEEIDKRLSKFSLPINKEDKVTAIIWSQGENDGEAIGKGILNAEEYKKDLKQLISEYREKYGADLPFIIIETGRNATCKECDEGYAVVRKIQDEVAVEDERTYIGYNETKYFIERKWLKDPVHYNPEAINDIGEKIVRFIVANHIK